MTRALAILLIVISLACSVFRPKPAPYPEGVIFPLAEAGRVDFEGRAIRSLVKAGGKLYFSTDKGILYCLDEPGRQILWSYVATSALGCPPAVGSRSIAVRDVGNNVYGLSLDGALLWKTQLPGSASSDICHGESGLYVGTREGQLYALSPETGKVLWTFRTDGAIEAACVVWYSSVVLSSTDGGIYFLGPDGKLRLKLEAAAAIRVTPLAEGGRLYYGADDESFSCLDLKLRKRVWRMRAGGRILSTPRADEKRVYFSATNTVLYALNKRSGDIDWWRILPTRSPYIPEIAEDKILASSASPVVVGLERRTGEEAGRYDVGLEVRTNPSWSRPDILIALYDFVSDKGGLARLQKQVKVELSASLPQPVAVGAEVVFKASAVGFYLPKYEFSIRRDGQSAVVQEESDRSSWTWFPEKEEKVIISVKVRDARETRESEISFEVAKSKEVTKPK